MVDDNDVDIQVDDQISVCLNLEKPISFFLFAGAGSGKTGSLVKALKRLRDESGKRLRLRGQRVGVITYTNAACDEIKQRLDFDPLVEVSTIHSFVWSLIGGFHADIKQWLKVNLKNEIAELEELQVKGRAGTKAALDREKSIETKQKRLDGLDDIKRFTYSPNGDNRGRDSLNHAEVIKIGADLLTQKQLMQTILVNKFPILLIDESQDTNKLLMDAFLAVQAQQNKRFCLGLFGDTMQRIYADGKMDLGKDLPSWAKPVKKMNHRCPRRIVKLINKIRSSVDTQEQSPRTDKEDGFVHLFILPSGTPDKLLAEHNARQRMVAVTGDPLWNSSDEDVKTLILEHHMAARRMGFLGMFEPLYQASRLKTALMDGSLPGLRFFSQYVLPLVQAKRNGDEFIAAAIVRKFSPLLSKARLKRMADLGMDQSNPVKEARVAVEQLIACWSINAEPRFVDILRCVSQTGLFEIPESLRPIASRNIIEQKKAEEGNEISVPEDEDTNSELDAWDKFMLTPFSQIEPYTAYVKGLAPFDTHQGVKGLEFPRVLVVMDDDEARGFLFSYGKLFGVKDKTKSDLENERDGKDTGIDRTRRLFYVTCSRAEKSLAIVAYSSDPDKVRDHVVHEGWFENGEVEILAAQQKGIS